MTNTIDHIDFPAPDFEKPKKSRATLLLEIAQAAIASGNRLEDEITESYTTHGQHTD